MKKTLFYLIAAVAFIPYAVFLGVGCLGVAISKGLAKLHEWTHAELYHSESPR